MPRYSQQCFDPQTGLCPAEHPAGEVTVWSLAGQRSAKVPRVGRCVRYVSPVTATASNCQGIGRDGVELIIEERDWRKATYSLGNGECIEVASSIKGRVAVRDSKNPADAVLMYSIGEWQTFLSAIKN